MEQTVRSKAPRRTLQAFALSGVLASAGCTDTADTFPRWRDAMNGRSRARCPYTGHLAAARWRDGFDAVEQSRLKHQQRGGSRRVGSSSQWLRHGRSLIDNTTAGTSAANE